MLGIIVCVYDSIPPSHLPSLLMHSCVLIIPGTEVVESQNHWSSLPSNGVEGINEQVESLVVDQELNIS